MAAFNISKSQSRLLALLDLSADDYTEAGQVLAAAGYVEDGVPYSHTWRTAAKLSDADLLKSARRAFTEPNDRDFDR